MVKLHHDTQDSLWKINLGQSLLLLSRLSYYHQFFLTRWNGISELAMFDDYAASFYKQNNTGYSENTSVNAWKTISIVNELQFQNTFSLNSMRKQFVQDNKYHINTISINNNKEHIIGTSHRFESIQIIQHNAWRIQKQYYWTYFRK